MMVWIVTTTALSLLLLGAAAAIAILSRELRKAKKATDMADNYGKWLRGGLYLIAYDLMIYLARDDRYDDLAIDANSMKEYAKHLFTVTPEHAMETSDDMKLNLGRAIINSIGTEMELKPDGAFRIEPNRNMLKN